MTWFIIDASTAIFTFTMARGIWTEATPFRLFDFVCL
jgi:hypothetical protein